MFSTVSFILGVTVQTVVQVNCVLVPECESRIVYIHDDKTPIEEHIYFDLRSVPQLRPVRTDDGMNATTDAC
jgi:hypothetical protein